MITEIEKTHFIIGEYIMNTFVIRKKMTAKENAVEIKKVADDFGWSIEVRGTGILTITKSIKRNDNEDFTTADMEYDSILGLLPTTSPGSTWGTDGGGVGALSAMQTGVFKMNKSGGSKNVLKALAKII